MRRIKLQTYRIRDQVGSRAIHFLRVQTVGHEDHTMIYLGDPYEGHQVDRLVAHTLG